LLLPFACNTGVALHWHAAAAAAAAANPLLESGPFPKWGEIKAEHVLPAVKQVIAEESASLDLLEQDLAQALKDGSISFDRVFLPLTQMRLRMDGVYSQIEHLSVSWYLCSMRSWLRWCGRQGCLCA
jgi:oligopeptidase A